MSGALDKSADESVDALHQTIWIDWGIHRRSRTLAQRLDLPLFEITSASNRWLRYAQCSWATWKLLHRTRPRVVVSTNPSLALGFLLVLLRVFYRYRIVSDAHLAGVETLPGGGVPQWLLDLHNGWMDMVIVTNDAHATKLRATGTPTWVCPDPLPTIPESMLPPVDVVERSVFFICSYDRDEPFLEVFEAFRALESEGYQLYVSGEPQRANVHPEDYPWVTFLGFVPEDQYHAYLRQSAVVMDLTKMENCLVCGAYEALAAHKPLILSDSMALRSYFGAATVLTQNDSPSIGAAVRDAFSRIQELEESAASWTSENAAIMNSYIEALVRELRSLSSAGTTPRT